ncbi:MAG TPA: hypothetical protein VM183_09210 [Burkholderiales bacterium]|nr:hypothetical protein [Burkholderiales bacterium]
MKRWQIAALLIVACALSAAAGFWVGFREGWTIGAAADLLPRGARSVAHLEALQAGKVRPVVLGLEFDVDNGLIWGYEVLNHPMRELWRPVWGLDVVPEYEGYARRLADYRQRHPSSMRSEMFEAVPEFAQGAREAAARRDSMVERYRTKR